MALGAALAASIVVAMQVPLLSQRASASVNLPAVRGAHARIVWPSVGGAALLIPAYGVARSWHDQSMPIASLTKLMTTYVTLAHLPLSIGQTGPCLTVTSGDVLVYDLMRASDQSSVPVVAGESLCEMDLLEGLLVHSANNFADLLATMVAGSSDTFVSMMNQSAAALGLRSTHYADPSGYDNANVSSALDQARLAVRLMSSSLVRSIVLLTSVALPDAGVVGTYTPLLGTDNVIGVKSGRTSAAGGCDVMAMTFSQGSTTRVLYAVVLGQRGGDLLGPAGAAALALADSALALQHHYRFSRGESVGTVGWGARRAPMVFAHSHEVWWWSVNPTETLKVSIRSMTTTIRHGQIVGRFSLDGGTRASYTLVAGASVSPLTLWQRLR